MRRGRAATAAAIGGLVAVILAGCGSSSPPDIDNPVSNESTDRSTTGSSQPATIGVSPTISASSVPVIPRSSPPPSSSRPAPPRTTPPRPSSTVATTARPVDAHQPRCASSDLAVSALRGSGAQQKQYATVYVRNSSARACWLVGYASVSLRLSGGALGAPASPANSGQPAFRLAPSARAQALVSGPSTCQAAVSDTMRISAPGQSGFTDAPVPMRGCPLTVAAFQVATS